VAFGCREDVLGSANVCENGAERVGNDVADSNGRGEMKHKGMCSNKLPDEAGI
jgi:hypothetical protein